MPARRDGPLRVGGTYPHLAVTNASAECGIGAVVPWAGRLWYLTYPPHRPRGSDDKLYSLTEEYEATVAPESVGGTHACRMIHRESKQLIIGPYFLSEEGAVRVVAPVRMPARLTAVVRHRSDPARLVTFFGMEGELYDVAVDSLDVTALHGPGRPSIPGTHGKGARAVAGGLVASNNGDTGWQQGQESGALAEWDGAAWRLIARTPFTEVTGPDGILGGEAPADPVWALGWDEDSVLLFVREEGSWARFRLPRGSFTHDALHGWYTEWPRIRDVGLPMLLAHMHGLLWEFPRGFRSGATAGIRPVASYHRMPVDYCAWSGEIAMAQNNASCFDNPFVERPDSNLWFGSLADMRQWGPPEGWACLGTSGSDATSEPVLVAGFPSRTLHLYTDARTGARARVEIDPRGDGAWEPHATVDLPDGGYRWLQLPRSLPAEWLRIAAEGPGGVRASLHLSSPRSAAPEPAFAGLAEAEDATAIEGTLLPGDGPERDLWFRDARDGSLWSIGERLDFRRLEDERAEERMEALAALGEPPFTLDAGGLCLTDHDGTRLRLVLCDEAYGRPFVAGWPRAEREVVTERSLLNAGGTIYELPRPSSGGLRRMRAIASHGKRITDFASWRGLLVLAGVRADAGPDGHVFRSADGATGLWFGDVDDLWRLGPPRGSASPWRETSVAEGEASDAVLVTGFDSVRLSLRHDLRREARFAVEVDVDHRGWQEYGILRIAAGAELTCLFAEGWRAHGLRVRALSPCRVSATVRLGPWLSAGK